MAFARVACLHYGLYKVRDRPRLCRQNFTCPADERLHRQRLLRNRFHSITSSTNNAQSVTMRTIRIRRRGRRGHDRMVVGLLLPTQSVPITINVVSSNHPQAIQHYVIKFVSDLRQVGGFLIYTS